MTGFVKGAEVTSCVRRVGHILREDRVRYISITARKKQVAEVGTVMTEDKCATVETWVIDEYGND